VATCPSCHRPVAVARATCVYCGAGLPDMLAGRHQQEGPREPVADGPPVASASRLLLILDLEASPVEAMGRGLGLSSYEADLLGRRGGYHLHRILEEGPAEKEAERLRSVGVVVDTVPESEARAKPLRAIGGECGWGFLSLRTEEEPVTLRRRDLLIVVQGPIARQYQQVYKRRKIEVASLEEGFRVHFHRRADPRPVEIDGANFEFGFAVTGSTRLELETWIEVVSRDVPRDDRFRRVPPALGVAEPEAKGPLAAASALGRTSRGRHTTGEGESVVLDNGAQFAFYSGWRGAIERRRAG
jgi:hypothetical protein